VLGDAVDVEAEAILLHGVAVGGAKHHRFRSTSKLESLLFPIRGGDGYEYALLEGVVKAGAMLDPSSSTGTSAGAAST
jgi:hypothetical protein